MTTAPYVTLFAQIHLGHTACDIHGSHEATLYAESHGEHRWHRYNLVRKSLCYGDAQFMDLNSSEMLKALDDHMFMPHTRRSYRKLRTARKVVEKGALKSKWIRQRYPWIRSQAIQPEPVGITYATGTVDHGSTWTSSVFNITGTSVGSASGGFTGSTLSRWEDLLLPEITWDDPTEEEENPF